MSAAHTPGPWRVERDGDAIEIHSRDNPYASGPCVIAEVPTDFGEESALADAALIAAAPEQQAKIDALADALALLHKMWLVHKTVTLNQVAITAIENALRAAGRLS